MVRNWCNLNLPNQTKFGWPVRAMRKCNSSRSEWRECTSHIRSHRLKCGCSKLLQLLPDTSPLCNLLEESHTTKLELPSPIATNVECFQKPISLAQHAPRKLHDDWGAGLQPSSSKSCAISCRISANTCGFGEAVIVTLA